MTQNLAYLILYVRTAKLNPESESERALKGIEWRRVERGERQPPFD